MLSDLRYRLRALFDRSRLERELDDELRAHLDREIERNVRLGMSGEEATRRAQIAFGGLNRIKEDSRDARGTVFIETLLQDLRYAARGLRAKPTFTLGIVLTLALGIGANAAIFGIVDRLLLRPPAYLKNPSRVHRIYLEWTWNGEVMFDRNTQFARYLDLAQDNRSLSALAAFSTARLAVGDGVEATERPVTVATASYFDFFDARPVLGRFFGPSDDVPPTGSPVVVLGYPFWQTQYAGAQDVIGKQLHVGQIVTTIIGVAPPDFTGTSDQGVPALYMPITAHAFALRGGGYPKMRTWSWLELLAQRKAGVSVAAAEADLTAAYRRSWQLESTVHEMPNVDSVRARALLRPLQIGRGPQRSLNSRILAWTSGVALIVLLIACANVANLLISRVVTRRREIAMRVALGVTRQRLIQQLLTESLLLSAIGGVLGLAVARWGGASLRTLFLPRDFQGSVMSDYRVLAFDALVTIVVALAIGLIPAFQAGREDLAGALKAGSREGGRARSRTRAALLGFQAALSVVLLVGAGLFVQSLSHVRDYRLGFDVDQVVYVKASLRDVRLNDAEQRALDRRMLDEARTIPGVTHASLAASVPFQSNDQRPLFVAGIDTVRRLGRFILQAGNPEYFATMGTRILRGRAFHATDGDTGPRVAVVSDEMARVLWPGRDALGQCFRIGSDTVPCTTVIGIAEETRVRTFADAREYTYYLPLNSYNESVGQRLLVRVAGVGADYVETIRRRLQPVMPGTAYVGAVPMRALVDPNLRTWRIGATVFIAFGGLALLLAAIGLYSLVAYDVAQRTQEIGVRIALGGSLSGIAGLVVARGMRVIVLGLVVGGTIAYALGRWIKDLLFRASPHDPVVFGSVMAILIVVALVASMVPALRAARVDPNIALRDE